MIKCSLFSVVLPLICLARPGQKRTKKEAKLDAVFPLSSSRFSLRLFEAREISGVLGVTLPKNFVAAVLERVAATILHTFEFPLT